MAKNKSKMSQKSKGTKNSWSKLKISYWVVTALLALLLVWSAITQFTKPQALIDSVQSLGYPLYACNLLGISMILAAAAIIIPGYPKIREWAYAGLVILFVGAIYSHIAAGQPWYVALMALIYLAFTAASYCLWRKLSAS